MDEAGSKVRQQLFQEGEDGAAYLALSKKLEAAQGEKKAASAAERYDRAQECKVRELELQGRLEALRDGTGGADGAEVGPLLHTIYNYINHNE